MCQGKAKCERPKDLKGKPEECPPEQIQKCHGDVEGHPCAGEQAQAETGACTPEECRACDEQETCDDAVSSPEGCEHPEKLKGKKPAECSPEQIRECHGDAKKHPCVGAAKGR